MSIFAPRLAGGSAQGSLPPDGHPCKAEKSPLGTPLPPPEVSGLGDAGAGAGSGPTSRAGPGRAPLRGERGERAVAAFPARSRVLLARSHPRGRVPQRAAQSRRPRPFPGPFRRPLRTAARRAAVPCPAGRSAARKRRSARAPRGPPHTRGGDEEAEELRPAANGSGRGCALPGSPPGGEERGGLPPPIVYGESSPSPPRHCRRRGRDGEKRRACGAGPGEPHCESPAPRRPGTDGAVRCAAACGSGWASGCC